MREKLEVAIRTSWSKETSYYPDSWSEENPAKGQCSPTSLVIQDYMGGDILWCEVTLPNDTQESHYHNQDVDLTREQFPQGTAFSSSISKTGVYETTREFMLSFEDTRRRYDLLKSRVEKLMIETRQ